MKPSICASIVKKCCDLYNNFVVNGENIAEIVGFDQKTSLFLENLSIRCHFSTCNTKNRNEVCFPEEFLLMSASRRTFLERCLSYLKEKFFDCLKACVLGGKLTSEIASHFNSCWMGVKPLLVIDFISSAVTSDIAELINSVGKYSQSLMEAILGNEFVGPLHPPHSKMGLVEEISSVGCHVRAQDNTLWWYRRSRLLLLDDGPVTVGSRVQLEEEQNQEEVPALISALMVLRHLNSENFLSLNDDERMIESFVQIAEDTNDLLTSSFSLAEFENIESVAYRVRFLVSTLLMGPDNDFRTAFDANLNEQRKMRKSEPGLKQFMKLTESLRSNSDLTGMAYLSTFGFGLSFQFDSNSGRHY